ncbi:DUF4249 domain-containing protein [Spirosoma validum]|uniref:DUF4249 domain-containing protein n=1 Tax=Spirosoma validum TaxID=2771355 RepID=A0A927B4Z6_9BACT|nr:DUF4249 domain-containing protein [Spirosoma validum]MBD2755489.1 DUF4249 domain-containing protein [Spirosoma validum]
MKLRGLVYAHFLLAGLLAVSCVTEFQPDSVSIPPSLIVEGEITDQPGPYRIRLTRTADYSYKSLNLLETGATITISDNLGNQEILQENTGVYSTKATGLQGVAGRTYKVSIKTKDGKVYESTPELLKAAPPIQKLYYKYTVEPTGILFSRRQGWDVYLDTKDPEPLDNYYRWNWTHYEPLEACYKAEIPGGGGVYTGLVCCEPCWDITRCYNCINVNSDANTNGQVISGQFIMRVPYKSTGRYYLEVQQQAISEGAYTFWKSVRQLVSNTGGLFDAAPSLVQGNMRCISDPATRAYGFFGATGVSEQYIYVDRSTGQGTPDLDQEIIIPQPSACYPCENSIYRTSTKPRWWTY